MKESRVIGAARPRVETMARSALVHGAALLLLCLVTPSPSRSSESVSLGTGRSMVVELDDDFRRVRSFGGLHRPSDITPLPGGGLLLVDAGAEEVLELDASGAVLWRRTFAPGVQRARPRT